jgi:hypothetical protein
MSKRYTGKTDDGDEVIYIEKDGKLWEIKATAEGIIVDVYSGNGNEWLDSPFSATWDEMLAPEDDGKDDKTV